MLGEFHTISAYKLHDSGTGLFSKLKTGLYIISVLVEFVFNYHVDDQYMIVVEGFW